LLRGCSWITCFRNWKYFAQAWGEGLYAGEAFTEGSKGGEDHHRIRRDMVGLQLVGVEEVPEEVRHRQAKTPFEVGNEHDAFAGFRCRYGLSRQQSACNALRDSPSGGDPRYVGRSDLRPLPAGASLELGRVILPRG
jgi:hypothetical protein